MLRTFDAYMIPCRSRISRFTSIVRKKDGAEYEDVELYNPWFFTTKEGHFIKVELRPCWNEPTRDDFLPFAWTKLVITCWDPSLKEKQELDVPREDCISSMPYENLDNRLYRDHYKQELLTLFVKIMVTYWKDYAWEILMPTRKWWEKCFIQFKPTFLLETPGDLDTEGLFEWTLPFDFKMFKAAISEEIKSKSNLYKNYVRNHTSKIPKNVSTLMTHVPHTVVRAPIDIPLMPILKDYVEYSMREIHYNVAYVKPVVDAVGEIAKVVVYLDNNTEVIKYCASNDFITDKLMSEWIKCLKGKDIVKEKYINLQNTELL